MFRRARFALGFFSAVPVVPVVVAVSVVVAAVAAGGCGTARPTVVRELPAGLRPLRELVEGCTHTTEADGAEVMTCDRDLVFRVREVPVARGAPPRYFGDGVDFANLHAGRMIWSQAQLATSVDRGFIDRGEVHAVADDALVAVLLGAARPKTKDIQREASCETVAASVDRCSELLAAYLDHPPEVEAPKVAAGERGGRVRGRFFVLPETCRVVDEAADHGRYLCDDGTKLNWLTPADMDAAAMQAEAAIVALPDGDERAAVSCAVFDGDVRCETTPTAVVALGYLEKAPLVMACVVTSGEPLAHPLCQSMVRKK